MEVLVVIAILSILMYVGISQYIKYKADRELMRQANMLADELSWIKSQSIAKEPHGIVVNVTGYTIFKEMEGNCNFSQDNDEVVSTLNVREGITAESTVTMVFDRKGYLKGSNCEAVSTDGSIILKNKNENKKRIAVSKYGRVRIE